MTTNKRKWDVQAAKIRSACYHILRNLYPAKSGDFYDELLETAVKDAFGDLKLYHVVHWILVEDCIEYKVGVSLYGPPKPATVQRQSRDLPYKQAIAQGIRKYQHYITDRLVEGEKSAMHVLPHRS